MVAPPDPQPLSAHLDGGSGRLRDLLNRRTIPWLLAGVAAYVALSTLLPSVPVGFAVAASIGTWVLQREKRIGRARLLSAALSRRTPTTMRLSDVGPLSQDAVNRARRRILAVLILVGLFLAALVAGGWISYLGGGGTRELVVALVSSILFPVAFFIPALEQWRTWRGEAGLGPQSPRQLVTVVGFLPGGGLVLADAVVEPENVAAMLTQGIRSDRVRLTVQGVPVALAVTSGVNGGSDLVPGDVLVCHGIPAPGQVVALSSATHTYWPGVLRAASARGAS